MNSGAVYSVGCPTFVTALVVAQLCAAQGPMTGKTTKSQIKAPINAKSGNVCPETPTPAAYPGGALTVQFSSVYVEPPPAVFKARAAKLWRPSVDALTGLCLRADPRQDLNAAWVGHQFEANHLLNKPVAFSRVLALIQLINTAYVQNGYVNTGVVKPQVSQGLEGVLMVKLIAGGVKASWPKSGANGLTQAYLVARLPAASVRPLDANALERQFRLLDQDPNIRTISVSLEHGSELGEGKLNLDVDPQPRVDLYATLADSRSPSVGGERFAIGGLVRNALVSGATLSGEFGVTDGLTDGTAGYAVPLSPALTFDIHAEADSAAVVDEALRALDVRADEVEFESGLTYMVFQSPLTPHSLTSVPDPAQSLAVGVRIAHRDTTTSLLGSSFSFSPGAVNGRADYTALRLSTTWTERGVNQVFTAAATGSLGLGGTGTDEPGLPKPDPNFKTILAQVNYANRLIPDRGVEFRTRLAGQWADGLLYSGERLAVGGASTVRGYRENLLLADTGLVGSVEIGCPMVLTGGVCGPHAAPWKTILTSVFFDSAFVQNRVGPQPVPRSLQSVGVSLRWTPASFLAVQLAYGYALRPAPLAGSRDLEDDGVHFQITLRPIDLWRGVLGPDG